MADDIRKLRITRGSTKPFEIYLQDDSGKALDLTAADKATFRAVKTKNGTEVLARRTSAGTLTIDKPNKLLRATITGVESSALPVGVWPAQASVRFNASEDQWYFTEDFQLIVEEAVADKT